MRIRLSCPHCGTDFAVAAEHAGKTGRCPNAACRGRVKVPAAGGRTPPPPVIGRPGCGPGGLDRRRGGGRAAAGRGVGVVRRGRGRGGIGRRRGVPGVRPRPGRSRPDHPRSDGHRVGPRRVGGRRRCCPGAGPRRRPCRSPASPPPCPPRPGRNCPSSGDIAPFVTTYCGDCHGEGYAEADIDFSKYGSADAVREHRGQWERTLSMLKLGVMPPGRGGAALRGGPGRRRRVDRPGRSTRWNCAGDQRPRAGHGAAAEPGGVRQRRAGPVRRGTAPRPRRRLPVRRRGQRVRQPGRGADPPAAAHGEVPRRRRAGRRRGDRGRPDVAAGRAEGRPVAGLRGGVRPGVRLPRRTAPTRSG